MTETQRAAMQAAHDALIEARASMHDGRKQDKAITLLAAAMVEPEPADEQIGWLYTSATSLRKKYIGHRDDLPDALRDLDPMPVYARPQRREPLTDEQRKELWRLSDFRGNGGQADRFDAGIRAAELVHGIGAKP